MSWPPANSLETQEQRRRDIEEWVQGTRPLRVPLHSLNHWLIPPKSAQRPSWQQATNQLPRRQVSLPVPSPSPSSARESRQVRFQTNNVRRNDFRTARNAGVAPYNLPGNRLPSSSPNVGAARPRRENTTGQAAVVTGETVNPERSIHPIQRAMNALHDRIWNRVQARLNEEQRQLQQLFLPYLRQSTVASPQPHVPNPARQAPSGTESLREGGSIGPARQV